MVSSEEYGHLESTYGAYVPDLLSLAEVWSESTQRIALRSTSSSLWLATPETVQNVAALLRRTGTGVANVRITSTFTRPAPSSATEVAFTSEKELLCEQRSALHHALTGEGFDCDGKPLVGCICDLLLSPRSDIFTYQIHCNRPGSL